jgi:hypothetical protein
MSEKPSLLFLLILALLLKFEIEGLACSSGIPIALRFHGRRRSKVPRPCY